MNKLDNTKRAQVIAALVQGNSIRATCRMAGVSKGAATKLLIELGRVCSEYPSALAISNPPLLAKKSPPEKQS
jgi:hypothetical protein